MGIINAEYNRTDFDNINLFKTEERYNIKLIAQKNCKKLIFFSINLPFACIDMFNTYCFATGFLD